MRRTMLKRLITTAPPVLVMLLLAMTLGWAAQAQGDLGRQRARDALKAQSEGQLAQALALFNEALSDKTLSNDRRALILNDRGALLARMNQPKAALADFNRAVQLYPEYPAIYNNRGSTLLTVGLAQEAIKDFDRALLLAPKYVAAYNNRAGALMLLKRHRPAISDYTKALKITPDSIAPLVGRGRALLADDRPQAAQRDFSQAIKRDGRLALGYRSRAKANMQAQGYKLAVEDLSRAAAFEPTNPDIYLERGNMYLATGNVGAAIRDFTKALELSPDHLPALSARALAYLTVDGFPEADADIMQALRLNPRAAAVIAARAMLYQRTQQPDLARRELARAYKLAPKRPEVLLAKAFLDEAAGNKPAAIKTLLVALKIDPTFSYAAAMLKRLGGRPPTAVDVVVPGLGTGSWQVVKRGKRWFAVSDQVPGARVPIEMVGEGKPRLIKWFVKRPPNQDIGLLRFSVGRVKHGDRSEAVENVAIVHLIKSVVLGVIPDRQGAAKAKWEWGTSKLVVSSVDGLRDEFVLRAPPKPVAARTSRYRDGSGYYTPPEWMPWGESARRTTSRRSRYRRRRPKTFFDFLFGN